MNRNNGLKKRGSIWRCMSPLVVYLLLQNAAALLVMIGYYIQQGFFKRTDLSLDALMDEIISSMLENMNSLNFASMIVSYIILIPIFLQMCKKDEKLDKLYGLAKEKKDVPAVFYLFLVVAGAASCLAGSNMTSMSGLINVSESYGSAMQVLYSNGVIAEIIGLGILAPIAEELLFRKLIYRRFLEFTPVIPAMIWASLIFALLHGNLVQGIYAFIMGVFFCYVYERYASIKAAVVMHMSSNLIAVLATETGILDFMSKSKVIFYAFTMICCVILIALIYLIERYVRPITEKSEEK